MLGFGNKRQRPAAGGYREQGNGYTPPQSQTAGYQGDYQTPKWVSLKRRNIQAVIKTPSKWGSLPDTVKTSRICRIISIKDFRN